MDVEAIFLMQNGTTVRKVKTVTQITEKGKYQGYFRHNKYFNSNGDEVKDSGWADIGKF